MTTPDPRTGGRPAAAQFPAVLLVAGLLVAILLFIGLEAAELSAHGSGDDAATAAPFELTVAPLVAAARQAVRRGEWPLWHDRAGAGYPLLASADGQLLHPFTLPLYPLPFALWLPVIVALRIACGLGLAWLLLRRRGVAPGRAAMAAAVHGAVVAALAGRPLGTFAALAPGLLLAVDLLVHRPRRRGSTAAVLAAVAALLLTAEPVPTVVSLLAMAAFLAADGAPLPPVERRDRALRFVALAAVAALACAPVVALTVAWFPSTHGVAQLSAVRGHRLLTDPLGIGYGSAAAAATVPNTTLLLAAALAVFVLALGWLLRRRHARGATQLPHLPFFAGLAAVGLLVLARPPLVSSLVAYLWLPPAPSPLDDVTLPWIGVALAWLVAAADGGGTAMEDSPALRAIPRGARRPGHSPASRRSPSPAASPPSPSRPPQRPSTRR